MELPKGIKDVHYRITRMFDFEELKACTYKTFRGMPKRFSVPGFYSIYFNLSPTKIADYLKKFKQSPIEYEKAVVEGVRRQMAKSRELLSYKYECGGGKEVALRLAAMHTILAVARVDAMCECVINCPPAGYNLESLVDKDELRLLEGINKKAEANRIDDEIYGFIEDSVKKIGSIVKSNPPLVKGEYMDEVVALLDYKDLWDLMRKTYLQLLYAAPGVLRFSTEVTEKFLALVPHELELRDYFSFEEKLGGIGTSPGIAVGNAVVCKSIREAIKKIKGGEILVCPKTDPSWGVFFNKIRAVITEAGGRLSHAAIVARENGIPCVVGVDISLLKDGMKISVDGSQGKVEILS